MDANYQKLADLVGKVLAERWMKVIAHRRDRGKRKSPARGGRDKVDKLPGNIADNKLKHKGTQ